MHFPARRNPAASEIGGDIAINCFGFDARRINGKGIWGEPSHRAQ